MSRAKLLKAVEEVEVGYTRRYGQGYPEAHELAKGVRVLVSQLDEANAELDEVKARALAYGTEVLDLRYRIVELEAKLKECKCEGF